MTYIGGIGRGLLRQKMSEYRQEQEASGRRGSLIRHTKKNLEFNFEMANIKTIPEDMLHRLEILRKRKALQSNDILFQDAESQDQSNENCNYKLADGNIKDKRYEVKKQLDASKSRCNENNLSNNTGSISYEPTYDSKQMEAHCSESPTDSKIYQSDEDISQNVDNNKEQNDNVCNDTFAHADSEDKYHELTEKLDAFQIDDDGIKFNIKLRNLLNYFKERSGSPAQFDELLQSMYKSCLHSRKLIPKFVRLITTRSIQKMEIQGRKFLPQFVKLLQQDFEQCEALQLKNVDAFHNFIALMGEFLAVKKNFEPVKESLLVVLGMLLDNAEAKDVVLFLEQIFVNNNNLGLTPSSPLMIQLRKTLIEKDLQSESRTRLMLALDLVLSPASLKNADLMNLYKDLLGVE